MHQTEKFASIQDLFKWFEKYPYVGILKPETGYFIIECPNDTAIVVNFNTDDTIDEIILKTIERFEDFDADEEFTELWSVEFARHNHFVPTQFISMLNADERFLRKTAFELREARVR